METTNTSRTLNYSFIPVPTNLYFALDVNLRNALTVLVQLSNFYADADGYFFRTIEDLMKDFKYGKNLTIAVIESLYQYNLLLVKSVGFTKKNKTKQVNFYKVNFEHFKDFEQYNLYTITNNEELHLETVDYRAKGFKVTYTNQVENIAATIVYNSASEETPSKVCEKPTEPKEMALNDTVEDGNDTPTTKYSFDGVDEVEEMISVFNEVEEWEKTIPPKPTNIETRSLPHFDQLALQRCIGLVERYENMTIPSSNVSLDMCNKGYDYLQNQFKQGLIDIETRDKLTRRLVQARFKKHIC